MVGFTAQGQAWGAEERECGETRQPSTGVVSRVPEPVHVLEKRRESRTAWAGVGCGEKFTSPDPPHLYLGLNWPVDGGRVGPASRPAWRWGRVSRELLLPPAAALRGCSAAASGAGAAAGASGTEPSPQVHGCGDSSGMTGHHGWGYGQNDGRRRPRPAPIR